MNEPKPSGRNQRRFGVFTKAALAATSVLVAFAVAELLLRAFERRAKTIVRAEHGVERVADARLGFRQAEGAPGHDANGFRNARVLDRADVVAIGDSQTWGWNVAREQSWPAVLERLSGRSVYNLSVGGYGPVQYLELLDDALRRNPRDVVVAIYLGNDLFDAYMAVCCWRLHPELAPDSAGSGDLSNNTVARAWERTQDEIGRVLTAAERNEEDQSGVRRLLNRSRVARLLDDWSGGGASSQGLWRWRAAAAARPDLFTVVESKSVRTAFTPPARLLAVDREEPRIAAGLAITTAALDKMARACQSAGVRLHVVMLPTKEAIHERLVAAAARTGSFDHLIVGEATARKSILATCERAGIDVADVLPALAGAVQNGVALHPANGDDHCNAAGYALIARQVLVMLSQDESEGPADGAEPVDRPMPVALGERGDRPTR